MLLKVFLVDDEIATREGIRSSFPWDEENYTLVGEAPDGEMALPMIADEKPDVVVTDIRMPFMDGLALSRAIRRSMPWIHIVILSGYSEFAYARQAISLGVEEYLLKPVTVEDLRSVLERIRGKIQEERRNRESEQQIRQQMASGIRFVQDKLLGSLLSSPIDGKTAESTRAQMENLGIHVTSPYYAVLDIRFFYPGAGASNERGGQEAGRTPSAEKEARASATQLLGGADRERGIGLLQPLADQSGGSVLLSSAPHGIYALLMGDTSEALEEQCYTFASSVVYTLEHDGARNVLVCIGETCSSLDGVHESMRTARHIRHRMDARQDAERMQIVGVQEMEDAPLTVSSLDIQPLYEQLQYIMPEEFREVFQAYTRSLQEADMHTGVSDDYLRMEAVLTASRIVREAGGDPSEVLELRDYETAMTPETQDTAAEAAERLLLRALAFRDRESPVHGNRAVLSARQFLAQNFTDPNLMLQDAAKAAGMSLSRFSTVFSQETGVTFTEYLTGLRMGKAKELLRATQMRSSEISSAVGYSDRHYFSYLFKKNTGMTPSEFRETCREQRER